MNIGGIDAGVWNDKSTKSWVFFRLGEMYLNYAEALYKTGDESGAREYLNKIRDRARGGNKNILPDITASGEELWKAIMHERRVELAFEEHRFFDVRRWMLPAEDFSRGIWGVSILKDEDTGKMTYKRFKVLDTGVSLPQNYYFAIPRSEAQKNKNLTLEPYN